MVKRLDYKRFEVDLEHLMRDIEDHYTYPIEEAAITENLDNCIDEHYKEIHFNLQEGALRILMLGDGMPEQVFWSTLPKIAATTKMEAGKTLGRYGWGMKVCMSLSEEVWIETGCKSFHGAQSWKLIHGEPYYKEEEPLEKGISGDFTLITLRLNAQYRDKFTPEFVERTLQKFYPTLLRGAKVKNREGEKRVLKIVINSKPVGPSPEPEYEKEKPLKANVGGQEATGYLYLAKQTLPEEQRGICVIVHGRAILRQEFFGVYSDINDRITGYVHADFLVEELAGDKTSVKKATGGWRWLSEKIGEQFADFAKEIGAIREEKPDEDILRRITKDLNDLIKHFPELQDVLKKIQREVLIKKHLGSVRTKLSVGAELTRGIEAKFKGGKGVPVWPGEQPERAPTGELGEEDALRIRRKAKGNVYITFQTKPDVKRESWFSPEGVVVINRAFPTFMRAKRLGKATEVYHNERSAIEAIFNYAVEVGAIKQKEADSYRIEVLSKWGQM